jgi:hypothetical protein
MAGKDYVKVFFKLKDLKTHIIKAHPKISIEYVSLYYKAKYASSSGSPVYNELRLLKKLSEIQTLLNRNDIEVDDEIITVTKYLSKLLKDKTSTVAGGYMNKEDEPADPIKDEVDYIYYNRKASKKLTDEVDLAGLLNFNKFLNVYKRAYGDYLDIDSIKKQRDVIMNFIPGKNVDEIESFVYNMIKQG